MEYLTQTEFSENKNSTRPEIQTAAEEILPDFVYNNLGSPEAVISGRLVTNANGEIDFEANDTGYRMLELWQYGNETMDIKREQLAKTLQQLHETRKANFLAYESTPEDPHLIFESYECDQAYNVTLKIYRLENNFGFAGRTQIKERYESTYDLEETYGEADSEADSEEKVFNRENSEIALGLHPDVGTENLQTKAESSSLSKAEGESDHEIQSSILSKALEITRSTGIYLIFPGSPSNMAKIFIEEQAAQSTSQTADPVYKEKIFGQAKVIFQEADLSPNIFTNREAEKGKLAKTIQTLHEWAQP